MSEERQIAETARLFSQAADAMVDACRRLEQHGVADEPIERLLLALEEVTHVVHRLHPPEEGIRYDRADVAGPPACLRHTHRDPA